MNHNPRECWCGIDHSIQPLSVDEASRRITAGTPLLSQAKYTADLLQKAAGALENLIVRLEHAKEAESNA